MLTIEELLRIEAKLKTFVNGDGGFQTRLVKASKLLIFQFVLASEVGVTIPRFLRCVIGKYSVDFEDRFDRI